MARLVPHDGTFTLEGIASGAPRTAYAITGGTGHQTQSRTEAARASRLPELLRLVLYGYLSNATSDARS